MHVSEAIRRRVSTRAFLPEPAPSEALVREILDVARWAPSGGNVQPWKVIALAGEARDAVVALARARLIESPASEEGDRPIYPSSLWEPHWTWRRKVADDMYALLGVPPEDRLARLAWVARNFEFFDAPVGLFFVIDERMGHGQWAHLGMFMMAVALAAEERGLATCMQEAWARLRILLKAHFALAENEMVYAGMALGYADPDAPVNRLRTERAEVSAFARFEGF